ncbi:hypothetical protein, partial [Streptomyces sp. NPDC006307]|uniref:hypothetical protein n=1 Tax=Streptomyces sp. NPDC006307 TaxID=3156748 RepID=UPI0033B51165
MLSPFPPSVLAASHEGLAEVLDTLTEAVDAAGAARRPAGPLPRVPAYARDHVGGGPDGPGHTHGG